MKSTRIFKLSKKHLIWQQAFTVSFSLMLLTAASVTEASDLQIYAKPDAGKKTLIMMLDTSGSMGVLEGDSILADYGVNCTKSTDTGGDGSYTFSRTYCPVTYSASTTSTYYTLKDRCFNPNKNADGTPNGGTAGLKCYDRIARLKDGMFAVLNSNNTNLADTKMGLGNFSSGGDGRTGQILVAAKELGAVGSAHRNLLKSKIALLTAKSTTPSAHAYAEAASYLMGTTTYSQQDYDIRRDSIVKRVRRSDGQIRYSYCTNYDSADIDYDGLWQPCSDSGSWTSYATSDPGTGSATLYRTDTTQSTYNYFYYYKNNPVSVVNADSGVPKSKVNDTTDNPDIVMNRAATNAATLYKSPLPAVASRVSCDGQGVYFLSDGVPNYSSDDRALALMQKSLDTKGASFACSTGLPNSSADSGWRCMGAYSRALFDPSKNPTGVSIKTAFVGFGKEFAAASISGAGTDTKNACKISSRAYKNKKTGAPPDDKCSPGIGGTDAVPSPTTQDTYDGGYGNGGFFQAGTASDVTSSVIQFIENLNDGVISPLPTGAAFVPVDALNPSGFQPYGFLRMLAPNPGTNLLTWQGNLKKYHIFNGALTDTQGSSLASNQVVDSLGRLRASTKDIWNNTLIADGGLIDQGGAYWRVPMPATGRAAVAATPDSRAIPEVLATPNTIRTVFTDVASSNGTTVTAIASPTSGTAVNMLRVPEVLGATITTPGYVLGKFQATTGQTTLKDFPLSLKLRLLNYLGYPINLTSTALPGSLAVPEVPFLSMGGVIHSMPVQMTYSGQLRNDELDNASAQSVLYGTMEGGLHLVDSATGVEQMVFVPAEILNSNASSALRKDETGLNGPMHGVDAAWVADPAYRVGNSSVSGGDTLTPVTAKQMNVYGGLRMGGSSYYALDLLTPTAPKLLFRISWTPTGLYSRLGQTWSKPVLANVRYDGKVTRVMIVGGGYDPCYENPRFRLNATVSSTDYPDTTCNGKTEAQGNAVYMVNAKTGALIWSATYAAGSTDGKKYMTNSIVSRISTLDRDADGLIDHLYFGDLGGQVFRADLNNASQRTAGQTSQFGVRVARLANLATTSGGAAITNGDNPRFYEAPTLTIHDQGVDTFILVGVASGDRSSPLDVTPTGTTGREGILPSTALTGRPVNNVYGILDRDFINRDLISTTTTLAYSSLKSKDKNLSNMQKDPQLLSNVVAAFFPYAAGTSREGWYRSLSSTFDGTEKAGGLRTFGGMKAFEEPVAITGNLLVPVYDPEGTGLPPRDPCEQRVVGETDRQQFCLPYGACLNKDGTKNATLEAKTGFMLVSNSNDPVRVIGPGIQGIALGPKEQPSTSNCGNLTIIGKSEGVGAWTCTKQLLSTRWYEKYSR